MERYNYFEAVKEDVLYYIKEHDICVSPENMDELAWKLHEDLFCDDSVTGNASGSYTFNTWKAEEYLCHNLDLLREASESFCSDIDLLNDPEGCDVTIRCYLLSEAIDAALEDLATEFEEKAA